MLIIRPSELYELVGGVIRQLESDGLRGIDVARTKIQMVRFDSCIGRMTDGLYRICLRLDGY